MADAGAALAFWTGKRLHGHAYPLALNASWAGKGGSFVENVMVWQRVDTPAAAFTLAQLGLGHPPQPPPPYADAKEWECPTVGCTTGLKH